MTAGSIQTPGFAIQRSDYGDKDLVVTLVTESIGVVSAFAAGAKGSRKRFPHQFGYNSFYDLTLSRRGGDLYRILRADVRRPFYNLTADLDRIVHLNFFLEVIRVAVPKEEPNRTLFHLLIDVYLVADGSGNFLLLHGLALRLLKLLGFEPQVERCVECHRPVAQERFVWVPHLGGVVHSACTSSSGVAVSPLLLQAWKQFLSWSDSTWRSEAQNPTAALHKIQLPRRILEEGHALLLQLFEAQFGHRLRTVEFAKQLEIQ